SAIRQTRSNHRNTRIAGCAPVRPPRTFTTITSRSITRTRSIMALPFPLCHTDVGEQQHRPAHDGAEQGDHDIRSVHGMQVRGVPKAPYQADQAIRYADEDERPDEFRHRQFVAEELVQPLEHPPVSSSPVRAGVRPGPTTPCCTGAYVNEDYIVDGSL